MIRAKLVQHGAAAPKPWLGFLLILLLSLNVRYLALVPVTVPEEHFRLGERLHATGVLSITDRPEVFRPPGFPVFVALVLHLRDAVSPGLESTRAVALAHGFLLSLAALALFLRTSRDRPLAVAFGAGALFGFHPLNVVIARALTCSTLHIVLVTAATLALSCALQARRRTLWALAAGALWGATTLVRPVSLLVPPFVLLVARWDGGKGSWRSALRFTSLFTVAMALVIGPYTLRNYWLTRRLIVVNAQEGHQLWGLSATSNPAGDIGEWMALWMEQGAPIFMRVTGHPVYSLEGLHDNAVALNDAYHAEARRNIRRDPRRLVLNALVNLWSFNTDSMCWWIDHVREKVDGMPRAAPARVFTVAILLLGLAGLVRALRAGETHARVVAAIYASFCVAHCLGFLLARYNYVRLPLVLLAVPLLFPRAGDSRPRAA